MSFDNATATAMDIDLNLLLGIVGIIITLIGIAFALNSKLSTIEENTKPIKKIEEIVTRLDERFQPFYFSQAHRTARFDMTHLGKVEVSAEPLTNETKYYITIEKPILLSGLIEKRSKETYLAEEEKRLFGKETQFTVVDAQRIVWYVPSTDPEVCTKYMSSLLKWLDGTYATEVRQIEDYEKITL